MLLGLLLLQMLNERWEHELQMEKSHVFFPPSATVCTEDSEDRKAVEHDDYFSLWRLQEM